MNRHQKKQTRSPFDFLISITGWLALIATWVLIAIYYNKLPDTVPVHFDSSGEPDRFGGRLSIFISPVVSTILFVLLTILGTSRLFLQFSSSGTGPGRQTLGARLMLYMKAMIAIIFFLATFQTIQVALNKISGLGSWFLPVILILVLIPLVDFIWKSVVAKSNTGWDHG